MYLWFTVTSGVSDMVNAKTRGKRKLTISALLASLFQPKKQDCRTKEKEAAHLKKIPQNAFQGFLSSRINPQ